jgi:hypothetical protein
MEGSISPISGYLEVSSPQVRSEITAGYRLMYFFGWTLVV